MNFEVHTNVINVAVCQAVKMWEFWSDSNSRGQSSHQRCFLTHGTWAVFAAVDGIVPTA